MKNRAFYFPQLKGKRESNKTRNKWLVLIRNDLPAKISKVLCRHLSYSTVLIETLEKGGEQ